MNKAYDIVIVGAGPAGSSLAIRLASGGKRVLLIEKERFPREKLCGEFISPECLDHFEELGVLNRIRMSGGREIKETVFYGRSGRGVTVPSGMFGGTYEAALGLSRAEMDLQLITRAREAGAEVLEETTASAAVMVGGRVTGLKLRRGRSEQTIEAPLVIDATGRTRALARRSDSDPARRAKFLAFKAHARNVDIPEDRCEIFSYRGGYGGTSRVEGGLYNLCFIAAAADVRKHGSDAVRVFREVVCSNKRAFRVFREIEFCADWLAVPIERFGGGILSPALGLLTVGDAAAFIDPFTGSGMLLALQSAKVAAQCILDLESIDHIAERYEHLYRAAFGRRLRVCSWLRRASFVPYLAEMTIFALSLSTTFKSRLVRATRAAETV